MWKSLPLNNSILVLSPSQIDLQHFSDRTVVLDLFCERADPEWQLTLEEGLRKNAQRNASGDF